MSCPPGATFVVPPATSYNTNVGSTPMSTVGPVSAYPMVMNTASTSAAQAPQYGQQMAINTASTSAAQSPQYAQPITSTTPVMVPLTAEQQLKQQLQAYQQPPLMVQMPSQQPQYSTMMAIGQPGQYWQQGNIGMYSADPYSQQQQYQQPMMMPTTMGSTPYSYGSSTHYTGNNTFGGFTVSSSTSHGFGNSSSYSNNYNSGGMGNGYGLEIAGALAVGAIGGALLSEFF